MSGMTLNKQHFIFTILVLSILLFGTSYSFYKLGELKGKEKLANFICKDPPSAGVVWIESNYEFFTNDIVRAQKYIPFAIVFPSYIPGNTDGSIMLMISGKIDPSITGPVEIKITYYIQPNGQIIVSERNNSQLAGALKQQNLEKIEINGKQVMKDKNNTTFYFDSADIGIIVHAYNVPGEEVLKVVESMIR
jgi:hypothetical protein